MLSGTEANWIVGTQIPAGYGVASGAVRHHPVPRQGVWRIQPYDANIGVWGMLHGGQTYGPAARTWMEWYFDHLNWPDHNGVDGTIYNHLVDATTYAVSPVTVNGVGVYDNTAAYAASFITLCRKYAEVTGNKSFLRHNEYQINAVIGAMRAAIQPDHLSWTRPDYPVKCLMHNCEVYQGLNDAAWLYANVFTSDPAAADHYQRLARDTGDAVNMAMWDHSHDMFVTLLDENGGGESADWSVWNPDSLAQLWPVKSALDVWPTGFDAAWPNWIAITDNPDGTPWAVLAYVASMTGRRDEAKVWLNTAQALYINNGHPLPWNVREAGYAAATAWHEDM